MVSMYCIMIISILTIGEGSGSPDPCSSKVYTEISDITMKTDFIIHFGQSFQTGTHTTGWVRYTVTANGSLITDCPTSTECGVAFQYWMNDTLPSIEDGVVKVAICGRVGSLCCDKEEFIEVKNCSDYVVYNLKPVNAGIRYCFAADPITTTTTTTTVTVPTTANVTVTDTASSGSIDIVMIAAIGGSVFILALVAVIAFVLVRKKRYRNSIGSTDISGDDWRTLNIAAIYRTKRKDLLIPRSTYISGKPTQNSSMVFLNNPRDEDFVDMREREACPRTRSELDIFSPPEIRRLGIDISAVYQTSPADKLIANTKFSSKRKLGDHVISVFYAEECLPDYSVDKLKFY